MKIRQGFVSNSSSTCFILDARDKTVDSMLPKLQRLPDADEYGYGRCTGIAVGKAAADYGRFLARDDNYLGNWILKWAEELGEENMVFIRESDEGMGGYLPDGIYELIESLALSEMEYH